MCGCFANPLENDMKFSPQTSSDFAHAQTLFSSVGKGCKIPDRVHWVKRGVYLHYFYMKNNTKTIYTFF